jgi:hypothetical protein
MSKTVFRCRGYSIDATPTALADGKFRAAAQLTKIGFNPEISFSALPVFSSEAEAIAYAKQFSEEWLSRKA